jgi:hypothetical protein
MQPVDRALAVTIIYIQFSNFNTFPIAPLSLTYFQLVVKRDLNYILHILQGYYNTDDSFPNR